MKRILQVHFTLMRGGIENFLMNHYRFLDKKEFQFDFLLFYKGDPEYIAEIQSLGGRVFYVGENVLNVARSVYKMKRLMIEHGPYDCVHSHLQAFSFPVLYAAKSAGIPKRIMHSHSLEFHPCKWKNRLLVRLSRIFANRLATRLFACSIQAGKALFGENRPFSIIRNSIDVESFQNDGVYTDELRISLGIPAQCRVYGNISRYDKAKNLPFAIDVFLEILKIQPEAVLLIGGPDYDSQEKSAVMDKIKKSGIENKVRLLGPIKNMSAYLHLMDCFLFTSFKEGLGMVAIECQACGTSVLASSEVPRDIDMGLGIVDFLPLQTGAEVWASCAITLHALTNDGNRILKAMNEHHYNIRTSIKELETFYSE